MTTAVRFSRSGRALRLPLALPQHIHHRQSSSSSGSSSPAAPKPGQQPDPYDLLSTPTWSTRSLLPPTPTSPSHPEQEQQPENEEEINLPHLLRLSALPQPTTPSQSAKLLDTLRAQLHFVRAVQAVDTAGVEPLRSIRDETAAGRAEAAVTLDTPQIRAALAEEEAYGRWKRPRRRRRAIAEGSGSKGDGDDGHAVQGPLKGVEDWDVLGSAEEKVGEYFVVRSGRREAVGESEGGE